MGGDGGVIAVKRAYCRGAGTADHTGDASRHRGEKQLSDKEDALQRMTTCYLTKLPLSHKGTIVACPYGRLYQKEAAVEALIRRKHGQDGDSDELGAHIRGLKDLSEVRFHFAEGAASDTKPSCPITGQEFNGQLPAFLLVPGNPELPNVISQRALKEMGQETLQTEYGPFADQIRLAPSPYELEQIQEALEAKREEAAKKKKDKKKDKKRKDTAGTTTKEMTVVVQYKPTNKKSKSSHNASGMAAAQAVRGKVQASIKGNDNLSSLFTNKDKKLSQQEQAANLFAR